MNNAIQIIKSYTDIKPKAALILGSGLGPFADTLDNNVKIPTTKIPGYPKSTVEGHQGFLVFGYYENVPVLAVQGRTHYYEGYSADQVTFIVDILQALGIKMLMVTNAAGTVNERFHPGDLMLITDQINLMFANPLIGKRTGRGSVDFYTQSYFEKIELIALNQNIALKRGVLCASSGPTYETAAEIKMIRKFGGDAASMSTVPEVIAANNYGMDVIGISCITNYATGIGKDKLTHEEVTITANKVQKSFTDLVRGVIKNIFVTI
jgi:purine-nucleoside phosphorylase